MSGGDSFVPVFVCIFSCVVVCDAMLTWLVLVVPLLGLLMCVVVRDIWNGRIHHHVASMNAESETEEEQDRVSRMEAEDRADSLRYDSEESSSLEQPDMNESHLDEMEDTWSFSSEDGWSMSCGSEDSLDVAVAKAL